MKKIKANTHKRETNHKGNGKEAFKNSIEEDET